MRIQFSNVNGFGKAARPEIEVSEYATRVGRGEYRRSSQNSNSTVKDDKPRIENSKTNTNTSREARE
jgi:hypothetical protein